MKLRTLVRIDRSARRLGDILGTLARLGLDDWLAGIEYDWLRDFLTGGRSERVTDGTTAERIRIALSDLGPAFIKAGQILSTRPDLIGAELTAELAKLQTQTTPDPWEDVEPLIETELGRTCDVMFRSIDHTPIASGSIGQVHGAVLPSGEDVVVKVMHPGIEDVIHRDIDLLVGLAELAEKHSSQLRRYQPLATARYFERSLLRELDFSYERRHLERFAENFEGDTRVRFPRVYPDLCAERVLTMERFHGTPVSDTASLKKSGVNLSRFAHRGGNVYLEMIFRDGFYHADPHPGNLFILDDGAAGLIDCGMVGFIDEDLREDIEDMLLAAVSEDAEGLTDSIMKVGQVPPELDEGELRTRVSEFLSDYVGQSVANFDVGGALQRLFDVVRDFHVILPQSFGMLVKTIVVLEGTARQLSADFSLAAMIRPYYFRAVRRRYAPRRLMSEFGKSYRDWKRLIDRFPRDTVDILSRFRKGTIEVHMEHRRLETTVDRLVLGLLTSAMFLGSAVMWSMRAPPTVWGVSLFGALGFLISSWLGAGLILSVRKAKRRSKRRRSGK